MCWRKGIGIHADARYAACRPRLTAAQGPRVEQRAILARTFQKNQSKAGQHAGRHLLYLTSSVPISAVGNLVAHLLDPRDSPR
jgi:hypothetical protein